MTRPLSTSQLVDRRQQNPLYLSKMVVEKEVKWWRDIFTDGPVVTFEGKCFQFSGTLEFGRREDAIFAVEKLGGFIPAGSCLTGLVNYLVVGNLEKGSLKRDGYGNKISKAMRFKGETHHEIQIIREHDFVKAVLSAFQKFEITERLFIKTKFTYKSLSDLPATHSGGQGIKHTTFK